jgi:hypothetical protein
VTLPEGKHMLEFFALLEAAGVAKAARARDPGPRSGKFLTAHAIAGDTVDGYLFPDTYQFVVPTSPAKRVLERLINAHRKAWNAAARDQRQGAGPAQGSPEVERSRRADPGVDRREGGGRSRRAPAHRAGVHQPPHLADVQAQEASRPIRRSATAAWCRW